MGTFIGYFLLDKIILVIINIEIQQKNLAATRFDRVTSGLWAPRATTAPCCFHSHREPQCVTSRLLQGLNHVRSLTSAGNEVFHATARLLRRVNKKPGTGGPGFYPP